LTKKVRIVMKRPAALLFSQVRIKLPDTEAADVVLDVSERFLDLRTPR